MRTFETVISVVNSGNDPFEAAEKAGEVINVSRMAAGMMVKFGKALEVACLGGSRGDCSLEPKRYLTEFVITSCAVDVFEAGEKADYIVDMSKVKDNMHIACLPTREVEVSCWNNEKKVRNPFLRSSRGKRNEFVKK
jgi:hypothetical protein